MRTPPPTPSRGRRAGQRQQPGRGFTLIELLVVIVIISALVALLLPAIFSARASARTAQVQAEISRLGSALADFKAKHGVYPPSSITLFEAGDADLTDNVGWSGDPRSMGLIRQIWGQQFNFGINRDINGDGDTTDTLVLTKGECLVFFLGGIPEPSGTLVALRGFSQNPADPFSRTGTNREGPYFEFDASRLMSVDDDNGDAAMNNFDMQEYRDPLPNQTLPYLYYSAYDGQGYLALRGTALPQPAGAEPPTQMVDVYLQSGTAPWNPQSFQIISPGADGAYGTGGLFDPDQASRQLVDENTAGEQDGNGRIENRDPERDNITNFNNGRLAPN